MMANTSNRLAALLAALIAGLAFTAGASAQATAEKPATMTKSAETTVRITGDVTAVDAAARTVEIKGEKGYVAVFEVDPAVKNLEKLKVGDRVTVDYKVGVALALQKGGDGIRAKVESSVEPDKAGAMAAKRTTIVANVESVDKKAKVAKLKGPGGKILDVAIQDPKVLEEVKAGDQVVAVVTQSVAVGVQPAAGAKPAAKPASK
ncbi:hypothetical protein [Rivibacter subsaxonicus]|uniref:Hyperosmotically inducible protein n=1 Tax=Rivibacter subsaxonicus TaxID=457575 RepID=A0A4Q7VZE7_9BURK|nr:hypothetical protein [Rivibacter subsaxonicus]RZU02244.1 hypothetical protein EV670_0265 [Rivibacter subsaxonicus]